MLSWLAERYYSPDRAGHKRRPARTLSVVEVSSHNSQQHDLRRRRIILGGKLCQPFGNTLLPGTVFSIAVKKAPAAPTDIQIPPKPVVDEPRQLLG